MTIEKPWRRKSAKDKVMDLLARRDHSKKELKTKLVQRDYSADEADEAIAWAEEQNWLGSPQELAERTAEMLHRKNKSYFYIKRFLSGKGLPSVPRDAEIELRKARDVVQSKLAKQSGFDYEEQMKVRRLLANRGFDEETIRKVIYEKS